MILCDLNDIVICPDPYRARALLHELIHGASQTYHNYKMEVLLVCIESERYSWNCSIISLVLGQLTSN